MSNEVVIHVDSSPASRTADSVHHVPATADSTVSCSSTADTRRNITVHHQPIDSTVSIVATHPPLASTVPLATVGQLGPPIPPLKPESLKELEAEIAALQRSTGPLTTASPSTTANPSGITGTTTATDMMQPLKPIEPVLHLDHMFTQTQRNAMAILCPIEFKYEQIDAMLNSSFNSRESNASMILDIIAIFLKGQKILYTEAKSLCEYRLNFLMIPTICITAVCSVISIALKEYTYGALLVSCLNALNFFFLNLINYMKLDAKSEAHRVAAYKFDKLQSKIEFNSGKAMFLKSASEKLPKLIEDTEKDVQEIRETNQFILPEEIRYSYMELDNTNVFTEVKSVQALEMDCTNRLKDVMNEEINFYIRVKDTATDMDRMRLAVYDVHKKALISQMISIRKEYTRIDVKFTEEINRNLRSCGRRWQLCSFMKT